MDEGQKGIEAVHYTNLSVYSKPGNKREGNRVPFYRNPKPPLYQARVAEMKKNFKMAPVKRAVRRTIPKLIQQPVKTENKAPIKLKHDMPHTTDTSFDDQALVFPDDLEISFSSGQLDISKQLEVSITSTVPDIDNTHQVETESQEFYQLPTPSKTNVKSRKRTYRDFPNYTYKKPYYGSKS